MSSALTTNGAWNCTAKLIEPVQEQAVTEEQIKSACDLGMAILQWAIFNRPDLKGGEVRSAIQTIIGPEADKRLQDHLNRSL